MWGGKNKDFPLYLTEKKTTDVNLEDEREESSQELLVDFASNLKNQ